MKYFLTGLGLLSLVYCAVCLASAINGHGGVISSVFWGAVGLSVLSSAPKLTETRKRNISTYRVWLRENPILGRFDLCAKITAWISIVPFTSAFLLYTATSQSTQWAYFFGAGLLLAITSFACAIPIIRKWPGKKSGI